MECASAFSKLGENLERWVPAGWQIAIPTSPSPTMVAYGWKTVSLPIGLELLDFEVKRNEGSDSPAGFKSTLRVVTADGETATGSCWMNHPFSYPGIGGTPGRDLLTKFLRRHGIRKISVKAPCRYCAIPAGY